MSRMCVSIAGGITRAHNMTAPATACVLRACAAASGVGRFPPVPCAAAPAGRGFALAAQPSVAAMVYHTALSHVAALGRYVSTRIVLLKAAVTEFWWAEDPEMADNPELLEVSKKEF